MQICIPCEKIADLKKQNRSNRSPNEGDIADLKISRVGDNFLGQRICGSTISNCRSGIFVKKHLISKKNQLNRSPDEGDVVDLKSVLFSEILGDGGRIAAQIWNSTTWIRISITWTDAE